MFYMGLEGITEDWEKFGGARKMGLKILRSDPCGFESRPGHYFRIKRLGDNKARITSDLWRLWGSAIKWLSSSALLAPSGHSSAHPMPWPPSSCRDHHPLGFGPCQGAPTRNLTYSRRVSSLKFA